MGYNTQILLLNDALGDIERHGEDFALNLVRTVHRSVRGDEEDYTLFAGGHSVGDLIPTQHADIARVFVSQGNWMWEVQPSGLSFERALTVPHMHKELTARCRLAQRAARDVLRGLGPAPKP